MSAADPSRPPAAAAGATAPNWADPARHAAFNAWLARVAAMHGLLPASLRVASADASFRRYFRIDCADGASRIVMDAPPAQENCAPFVQVAGLMRDAGLNVPRILDWDETGGFMLMTDLGARTMMEVIERDHPEANRALYAQALDALLAWQQASRPGVLPPYDEALLRRELRLFPDWYLQRHRGVTLDGAQAETLERQFALIVERNLAAPRVYVHRDFMLRNLIDNALRYGPDGGQVMVRVSAPTASGGAGLVVEDAGPGLDEAARARLGERFFRELGSGQSGSGLGWSIVRRLARLHALEIEVDRSPTLGGLRVTVRWPLIA